MPLVVSIDVNPGPALSAGDAHSNLLLKRLIRLRSRPEVSRLRLLKHWDVVRAVTWLRQEKP